MEVSRQSQECNVQGMARFGNLLMLVDAYLVKSILISEITKDIWTLLCLETITLLQEKFIVKSSTVKYVWYTPFRKWYNRSNQRKKSDQILEIEKGRLPRKDRSNSSTRNECYSELDWKSL